MRITMAFMILGIMLVAGTATVTLMLYMLGFIGH
jgi:hypothetical protein